MDDGALHLVLSVWVVALGATVGSFLNVVIARLPAGESIVHPRSRCPGCRAAIAWYDNVPVVSWLVLRGRCRRCGVSISFRYVVVELAGAAAAWLAWSRHGLALPAVVEFAFVAFLVALAAIDFDRWELPTELTYPLLQLGLAASAFDVSAAPSVRSAALGAPLGFAAFWIVMKVGALLTKREAMGLGDVFLLPGLAAFLGAGALVPVVLLASLQGSAYGLALVALGRSEPGPEAGEPPAEGAAEAEPPPATEAEGVGDGAAPRAEPSPGAEAAPEVEPDWVPPRHAVPFGPFLVAGALEWLYLADWLTAHVPVLGAFR